MEQTSVVCMIMWLVGNRCGVRYLGQFHNTMKVPRKAPRRVGAR